MIGGVGGDARNAQELEQPVERGLPPGGEVIEHARKFGVRCTRLTHGRTSSFASGTRRSSSQHGEGHNRRTGKIRLSDVGRLFGELHVDGLRAFATAIRLGFEGHALTFVDGGEA